MLTVALGGLRGGRPGQHLPAPRLGLDSPVLGRFPLRFECEFWTAGGRALSGRPCRVAAPRAARRQTLVSAPRSRRPGGASREEEEERRVALPASSSASSGGARSLCGPAPRPPGASSPRSCGPRGGRREEDLQRQRQRQRRPGLTEVAAHADPGLRRRSPGSLRCRKHLGGGLLRESRRWHP